MIRFTKAKTTPKPKKPKGEKKAALNKLKSFLTAAEPEAVEIIVSGLQGQSNAITYKELREAYLAGGITQKQFEKWQKDYAKLITKALAPKWETAAAAGAQQVKDKYPYFVYEPSVSAGMDFIKEHGAELVTNLAAEQREALNAVIAHVSGYTAVTPDEAARIIRPCVGLTKPQALANAKYREKVKNSIYEAHRKAHPHGNPDKAAQIAERKAQEAAARYAARQHRYRAQNIARTELAFAYNAGAYGATKDAQAQGYIGDCVKVWLTAYDERTCPVCSEMDDERKNMDEMFSNGKMLPPGHPSCRCTVAYEEIPGTNLTPALADGTMNDTMGQVPAGAPFDAEGEAVKPGQSVDGTDSPKSGRIAQTGTVDFSDKSAVLRQLRQAQIDFAGLDYEMNCTVTSDGKVWRVSGTSGQVNPWGIETLGSSLKGAYSYHNHPAAKTWYSFSAEDVRYFFASGEECAIAADNQYVYIMRRMADTLDIDPDVAYHRFKEIDATTVAKMKWDMLIDPDIDGFHETMKILSQELKFYYVRQKSK